ncbi:MAG: hypothetical protein IPK61_08140 [Saprospiraceae bacterium]|nr:hypothetical protein [Saprospiraceae bacterium]
MRPSLESLVERHEVAAVGNSYCQTRGRGHQLLQSWSNKLRSVKPTDNSNREAKTKVFLSQLEGFQGSNLCRSCLGNYPEVVWDMPPLGTINLHASLLPQYRGAAPIQRAILKGEKKSGLTSFSSYTRNRCRRHFVTGRNVDRR